MTVDTRLPGTDAVGGIVAAQGGFGGPAGSNDGDAFPAALRRDRTFTAQTVTAAHPTTLFALASPGSESRLTQNPLNSEAYRTAKYHVPEQRANIVVKAKAHGQPKRPADASRASKIEDDDSTSCALPARMTTERLEFGDEIWTFDHLLPSVDTEYLSRYTLHRSLIHTRR